MNFFAVLSKTCFIARRQYVYNLESFVVEQELEMAINLALKFLWILGYQYNVRSLSWFSLGLTPK